MNTQGDVLSDVLRSMRISGSTLLNDDYAPPWAIAIPNATQMAALLGVKAGVRVVAFHLVKRGSIEVISSGGKSIIVEAGEMIMGFGGMAHQILQGNPRSSLPVETLLAGNANIFAPNQQDQTRYTSLTCGVFFLHDVELNPLFTALPSWLHLSTRSIAGGRNFALVAESLTQEVDQTFMGRGYVIDRLLELLCAEAIRSHLEIPSTQTPGWISGLKDPVVGGAIALIHANPGDVWTVQRLAECMSLSPSRFAARFVTAIGDSPMAYVTKWRMNVASRLLTQTQQGIQEIATTVGYESLAAFNRAFKKHLGLPPAAWRSHRA
jgi:AraC-like DNA-binding protein